MLKTRKVFANNLKKYRTNSNMSQEKLAAIAGLHRTYISDLERCKRSISIDNIEKIALALGIDVYMLFMEGDNE